MTKLLRSDGHITVHQEHRVLTVTINRPAQRNALTLAMYDKIVQLCTHVATDHNIRAVVFTGAGEKAFAAGTDIGAFADVTTADEALAVEARSAAALRAIRALPQVTIASVNGVAAGGGCGIILACDLKLAADHALLGFPIAATLGNAISADFTTMLVDAFGVNIARRMLLSAELIPAPELQATGVWSWVGPAAGLADQTEALANRVSELSPMTQVASQDTLAIVRGLLAERLSQLPHEDVLQQVYGSADFHAAVKRFTTKTKTGTFAATLPTELLVVAPATAAQDAGPNDEHTRTLWATARHLANYGQSKDLQPVVVQLLDRGVHPQVLLTELALGWDAIPEKYRPAVSGDGPDWTISFPERPDQH